MEIADPSFTVPLPTVPWAFQSNKSWIRRQLHEPRLQDQFCTRIGSVVPNLVVIEYVSRSEIAATWRNHRFQIWKAKDRCSMEKKRRNNLTVDKEHFRLDSLRIIPGPSLEVQLHGPGRRRRNPCSAHHSPNGRRQDFLLSVVSVCSAAYVYPR